MKIEQSIEIDAPPSKVWAALAAVDNWPAWTESMAAVELIGGQPLGLGSEVRIEQPRLPATVWLVTVFEPGVQFAWESKRGGMTTVATHRVTARDGGSTVSLGLRQTGLLAGLVGLFYGGMSRRYVDMEARGLKRFCEGD